MKVSIAPFLMALLMLFCSCGVVGAENKPKSKNKWDDLVSSVSSLIEKIRPVGAENKPKSKNKWDDLVSSVSSLIEKIRPVVNFSGAAYLLVEYIFDLKTKGSNYAKNLKKISVVALIIVNGMKGLSYMSL